MINSHHLQHVKVIYFIYSTISYIILQIYLILFAQWMADCVRGCIQCNFNVYGLLFITTVIHQDTSLICSVTLLVFQFARISAIFLI